MPFLKEIGVAIAGIAVGVVSTIVLTKLTSKEAETTEENNDEDKD